MIDSRVFLLGLTLVFGPLFLLLHDFSGGGRYFDFFILSDQRLTFQTWLYFLMQHVVTLMLCFLLVLPETKFRLIFQVYFWLEVADTIDYLLTYNTVWFNVWVIPMSMNILKVLIFGYYVFRYGRVTTD